MEHRFDELAKALAEGVSRREALRRFAGGLAGALLASLGLGRRAFGQAPESTCERFCRGCGVKPASGLFGPCVSSCEGCENASRSVCACPPAGSAEVVCCKPGLRCCNRLCVDVLCDDSNCGSCGHLCPMGTTCSNGRCCSTCGSELCCPPKVCGPCTGSSTGPTEGTSLCCFPPG